MNRRVEADIGLALAGGDRPELLTCCGQIYVALDHECHTGQQGRANHRNMILCTPPAFVGRISGGEGGIDPETRPVGQPPRRSVPMSRCPQPPCHGRNVGYPTPPVQIRTWSLNHPAPTSGPDGKSRGRPWVQNPQRRPEGRRQCADPVPCKAILLRTLPQGTQPHPLEAKHKPAPGPKAGLHRTIPQPSALGPVQAIWRTHRCCDAFACASRP